MATKEPPKVGDKFYIPWRDDNATVTGLPYQGDGVDLVYDESGEKSYICINDWMNWIGGRENRITESEAAT